MTDEITLTLPREPAFYRIAHLVLGGLAVRLDVTFEHLEDLQLALAGVLDRSDADGELVLHVSVQGEAIRTSLGPFGPGLRAELEREVSAELSLRRLLDTVVDSIEIEERDAGCWVTLTKNVATVAGA